jgi:MFS family permease
VTLLPALVVAVAVTWALGGNLRLLGSLRLVSTWLVYAALGAQIVIFSPLTAGHDDVVRAGHLASYVALLAFAAANRRTAGMPLLGLGTLLNAVAIFLNGGLMPVDPDAIVASGWTLADFAGGSHHNAALMNGDTVVPFLGDVFATPRFPGAAAVSIGDLLLLAGACVLVYRACTPSGTGCHAAVRAPLRHARFVRLLGVQSLSTFASWIVAAVLVGWAYTDGGGLWASSTLLLVRGLAGASASWIGGRLADRVGRTRILARADAAQTLILPAIVAAASADAPLVVYTLFALGTIAGASSEAALRAAVPGTVGGDARLLPVANALLGTARAAAMAAGALAGGALSTLVGVEAILLTAAALFAATALGYATLQLPLVALAPPPAAGQLVPRLRSLRPVLPQVAMFAAATLATGLLNATLPGILERQGVEMTYGVGLGTIAAGLVVGQFVSGLLSHEQMRARTIAVALVCMGGAACLVGSTPIVTTTLLALFLVGLFDGVTETVFDTLVQRDVPESSHGAVFGAAQAIFTATMLGGFAAAPLVAAHAPVEAVALTAGAVLAATGLAGLMLTALPAVRRRPSPQPHVA